MPGKQKDIGKDILEGIRNLTEDEWDQAYREAERMEQARDRWILELIKKADEKCGKPGHTGE